MSRIGLDDSCSVFIKKGVQGAAEIEESVGVGCEGPIHLQLEELDAGIGYGEVFPRLRLGE